MRDGQPPERSTQPTERPTRPAELPKQPAEQATQPAKPPKQPAEQTPAERPTRPAGQARQPAEVPEQRPEPDEAPPVMAAPAKNAKKAAPVKKTTPAKKASPIKKAATDAASTAKAAAKKAGAAKKATAAKPVAVTNATPPESEGVVAATEPEPEPIVAPSVGGESPDDSPRAQTDKPDASPEVSDIRFNPGTINPAFLPEMLALAAVERFGGEARRRVEWYRVTYPGADGDAVSRAIAREFVRRARRQGFAAGLAGSAGLIVEAAGLGWLQAKLVLHLAAAYGHDPEDRRRAAELLVLQRVHGTVETAEAAVRAAEMDGARRADRRARASRMTAPLARVVGAGIVRAATARLVRRVVPGAGAIVGYVTAERSTEQLAARAMRFYRNIRR
ncbi:EcsC family protein [Dactylosporangium sp. NPDC048998]|uniref:EcsC family protein n=1 Tax=Dactylosporangium sp. NPDC048998 TaxID=3363976 RepID=UPI003713D755